MKGDKMTRKHYIKIASIIKDSTNTSNTMLLPTLNKVTLINRLSTMFKNDNYLFDYDKFFKACND